MANPLIQLTSRSNRRLGAVVGVCGFLVMALSVDARRASSADVTDSSLSKISVASSLIKPANLLGAELLHDAPLAPTPAIPAAESQSTLPHTRTIWMQVTAYCGCKKCCGPRACGITASGRPTSFNNGCFVAADTSLLPFGTQLQIPGYANGQSVPVIDRGSAIKGNHIDVFFPSHEQALAWGRRWLAVTIVE